MPLIVQCPRGCQVKMPRSRSGKIVRCPDCKCAMRVPKLTEAQLSLGKTIPVRGKVVHRRRIDPEEAARRMAQAELEAKQAGIVASESEALSKPGKVPANDPNPNAFVARSLDLDADSKSDVKISKNNGPDLTADQPKKKKTKKRRKNRKSETKSGKQKELVTKANKDPVADSSRETPFEIVAQSATTPEELGSQITTKEALVSKPSTVEASELESQKFETKPVELPVLEFPALATESQERTKAEPADFPHLETTPPSGARTEKRAADSVELTEELVGIGSRPEPPKPARRGAQPPKPPAVPASFIELEETNPILEDEKSWEERLTKANSDRKILARFFALCLCLVAIVNMVPAIYNWYHWTQLTDSVPLPRWIYILVFVGAIHLMYALFLAQIPDWSAMRAVALAMLFMAFVFGIVSTGLLVGQQGSLSGFLGIPYALNRQASIWCVAMLCLATLMAYWGGKESANWQRAEYLLRGIVAQSS